MDERGSASVELVLLTPLFVILLLFVVAAGRLAVARNQIGEAARAGPGGLRVAFPGGRPRPGGRPGSGRPVRTWRDAETRWSASTRPVSAPAARLSQTFVARWP